MNRLPGASWKSEIEAEYPGWSGYRDLLDALDDGEFPGATDLNGLLPAGLVTERGSPVRFVPAAALPGVEYERHIFETGQVSTREDSWHDLFNALVWCRWPQLKRAMNALHERHREAGAEGRRGAVRDALTLFDECGAVVVSSDANWLRSLASHDWRTVFGQSHAGCVLVTGHALLEKFRQPYKSMTAHALLLESDASGGRRPTDSLIHELDHRLASALLEERLLRSPQDLSALPLCGLMGWWQGSQDSTFYADRRVFRPLAATRKPAPVFRL